MVMRFSFVLLSLLLLRLPSGEAALYGIVTAFGANFSEVLLETVQIDLDTGAYAELSVNVVYVGESITIDGISTFDQKNQRLYYSTNFDSDFVYGVDVVSHELLAPISINSESIISLDWDGGKGQLVINGYFEDRSEASFVVPSNPAFPARKWLNLTQQGIGETFCTALNYVQGYFYVVHLNQTNKSVYITDFIFDSPSPKPYNNLRLSCGTGNFYPDYLFTDPKRARLVGFGYTGNGFKFFQIAAAACTLGTQNFPGIITAATFDPTTATIYLAYIEKYSYIVSFDTVSLTSKLIKVPSALSDLEVSYTV